MLTLRYFFTLFFGRHEVRTLDDLAFATPDQRLAFHALEQGMTGGHSLRVETSGPYVVHVADHR